MYTNNYSAGADTFPPPSKIYIESIGPNEINFSWSVVPISIGCSSFFYTISATQCGICSPNVTASNSSSCTNFNITPLSTAIAADPCDFAVQSVICENITGDMEHHLVTLAGGFNKTHSLSVIDDYYNYLLQSQMLPLYGVFLIMPIEEQVS